MTDRDPPGLQTDDLRSASAAVAKTFHRRIGKEMLAAWMAGYTALDVAVDPNWPVDPDTDVRELLTVKAAFIPTNATRPAKHYPPELNVQRYDLRGMDRDEADRLRAKLNDEH